MRCSASRSISVLRIRATVVNSVIFWMPLASRMSLGIEVLDGGLVHEHQLVRHHVSVAGTRDLLGLRRRLRWSMASSTSSGAAR